MILIVGKRIVGSQVGKGGLPPLLAYCGLPPLLLNWLDHTRSESLRLADEYERRPIVGVSVPAVLYQF